MSRSTSLIDMIGKAGESLTAVGAFMVFLGGVGLLVFIPYMGARALLQWTQTRMPVPIHAITLAAAFGLLLAWARTISGDRGARLFIALYLQGIRLPILYSLALLFFAVVCFASLSSWLSDLGCIRFEPPLARADLSKVQDFGA